MFFKKGKYVTAAESNFKKLLAIAKGHQRRLCAFLSLQSLSRVKLQEGKILDTSLYLLIANIHGSLRDNKQ